MQIIIVYPVLFWPNDWMPHKVQNCRLLMILTLMNIFYWRPALYFQWFWYFLVIPFGCWSGQSCFLHFIGSRLMSYFGEVVTSRWLCCYPEYRRYSFQLIGKHHGCCRFLQSAPNFVYYYLIKHIPWNFAHSLLPLQFSLFFRFFFGCFDLSTFLDISFSRFRWFFHILSVFFQLILILRSQYLIFWFIL